MNQETILVQPARYVRIPLAAIMTGYSVKAIRMKIAEHAWREDHEYIKAPDGHVLIDLQGYEQWAEKRRPAA